MTRVLKIPQSLPCADLYLDDLATIEELVRHSSVISSAAQEVSFQYEVSGSNVYNSVEELSRHGVSDNEFSMRVSVAGGHHQLLLLFLKRARPHLDVPTSLRSDQWALSAQLTQLFSQRRNRLADFMYSSNDVLSTLILTVGLSALLYLIFDVILFIQLGRGHSAFATWKTSATAFLLSAPFLYGQFRSNRVHFNYSRAVAADALQRRQNRNSQLIIGSVSGAIGAVVGGLLVFYIQWKLKWHFWIAHLAASEQPAEHLSAAAPAHRSPDAAPSPALVYQQGW